jgi:peptide-methionine (S)-S-oxide reductase
MWLLKRTKRRGKQQAKEEGLSQYDTDESSSSSSSTPSTTCFNPECPPMALNPSKRKYEIAVVACGSFWNPQRRFQQLKGVKRVVAGYIGGQATNPSFAEVHDHTQALVIEFNPKRISYTQILQMWRDNDDPWEGEPEETIINRAERSALFPMNSQQLQEALQFVRYLAQTRPDCPLHVDVECVLPSNHTSSSLVLYQAEEKHQDYFTKLSLAAKNQLILWANGSTGSGLCAIPE